MLTRALTLTAAFCASALPRVVNADEPPTESSPAVASIARADTPIRDPYQLPDAPRALSLPELTHPGIEWTSTTAVGALQAHGANTPELLERIAVEAPVGPRRWYLGLAYEAAYGAPVGTAGPAGAVGGNLELYGRTVWATRTGLAFGGGIGVLPPITTFSNDSSGSNAALAAISLQPWDYAYFRTGVLTARPFVDMRTLFGRFIVQLRQSFDFSIDVNDLTQRDVAATTTVYFGWLASSIVGIGLETTEYYLVDADVPDSQRAKVVAAPSIRFLLPGIQPAIGAFVGVGTPLAPAAENVWGLRFALTFVWDPRRPFFSALQLPE